MTDRTLDPLTRARMAFQLEMLFDRLFEGRGDRIELNGFIFERERRTNADGTSEYVYRMTRTETAPDGASSSPE